MCFYWKPEIQNLGKHLGNEATRYPTPQLAPDMGFVSTEDLKSVLTSSRKRAEVPQLFQIILSASFWSMSSVAAQGESPLSSQIIRHC